MRLGSGDEAGAPGETQYTAEQTRTERRRYCTPRERALSSDGSQELPPHGPNKERQPLVKRRRRGTSDLDCTELHTWLGWNDGKWPRHGRHADALPRAAGRGSSSSSRGRPSQRPGEPATPNTRPAQQRNERHMRTEMDAPGLPRGDVQVFALSEPVKARRRRGEDPRASGHDSQAARTRLAQGCVGVGGASFNATRGECTRGSGGRGPRWPAAAVPAEEQQHAR